MTDSNAIYNIQPVSELTEKLVIAIGKLHYEHVTLYGALVNMMIATGKYEIDLDQKDFEISLDFSFNVEIINDIPRISLVFPEQTQVH